MKKTLTFILVLCMVFSVLTGCGNEAPLQNDAQPSADVQESAAQPEETSVPSAYLQIYEGEGFSLKREDSATLESMNDGFTSIIGTTRMKNGSQLWAGSYFTADILVNSLDYEEFLTVMLSVSGTIEDVESFAAAAYLYAGGECLSPVLGWVNASYVILLYDAAEYKDAELVFADRDDGAFALCTTDESGAAATAELPAPAAEEEALLFTVTEIDIAGMMSDISGRGTITLIGVLEDGTEVVSDDDPASWFANAEITNMVLPEDTGVTLAEQDGGLWFRYLIVEGKHLESTVLFEGNSYSLNFTNGMTFACTVEGSVASLVFDPLLCQ